MSNKINENPKQKEINVNKKNINKLMIAEIDINREFTFVNKAFRDALNYKKGELIGKSFEETLHPDMPMCLCLKAFSIADEGIVWDGWVKSISKDGNSLWHQVWLQAKFNNDNEIIGYSISKRNANEEKIKSIIELYEEIKRTGKSKYFCGNLD